MKLVSAVGVVLHSFPFREAGRIVRVFTKEMGKISLFAKSARRQNSRFSASTLTLALSEFIFSFKETREIQNISSADLIDGFPELSLIHI